MKSKGFWRWCVIICKSVFLDFVHRLYFNKITTFLKLDLLPSSGKKGRTETLAAGKTWTSLRLAQPGAQQLGLLSFTFYLKTEVNPASETLQFYWNIDNGQSPKKHFHSLCIVIHIKKYTGLIKDKKCIKIKLHCNLSSHTYVHIVKHTQHYICWPMTYQTTFYFVVRLKITAISRYFFTLRIVRL
jgi:hypothetical protein